MNDPLYEARVADLLRQAHGIPTRPRQFPGLSVAAANACLKNNVTTPEQLLDAVCAGKVGGWVNIGPARIREMCEWLAKKFPNNPTEAEKS